MLAASWGSAKIIGAGYADDKMKRGEEEAAAAAAAEAEAEAEVES